MVTKETLCDGCDKFRRDVQAVGRDANGEPDAPDLCFVCRREGQKGRIFDHKVKKYVDPLSFERGGMD